MLYLMLSCVTLVIGPMFYGYFMRSPGFLKGLDGFIFVTIGGMMLTHIIPELLEHGGLLALFCILLGAFGPTLGEKAFKSHSDFTHNLTIVLGVSGLIMHTLTDGGAISLTHESNLYLVLSVIIHRLPEGLAVWWILRPNFGPRWASLAIVIMVLCTCIGYLAGGHYVQFLSLENSYLLQAFVTGWVLHVIIHQPHHEVQSPKKVSKYEYQAGLGSLIGCVFLLLLFTVDVAHPEHTNSVQQVISETHDTEVHAAHPPHKTPAQEHEPYAHEHAKSPQQLLDWGLLLAPWLLLNYASVALRNKMGLELASHHAYTAWMMKLAHPEGVFLIWYFLGWQLALTQLCSVLLLSGVLSRLKIKPQMMQPALNPSQEVFFNQIDRSAPWILFGLLLANMTEHANLVHLQPELQALALLVLLLGMQFCYLGSLVFAVALAWSGWSVAAVALILVAAPILNLRQLKSMNGVQGSLIVVGVAFGLWVVDQFCTLELDLIELPGPLYWLAFVTLLLLFAMSLLRLGPRAFIARLFAFEFVHHKHSHKHSHKH
jgi:zinc transporter ZupT